MAQLRLDHQKFIDHNTEVIVIGPDDAKSFAKWWHDEHMPFIGIADPEHAVANEYGQQVKVLRFGRMPALIVIDTVGRIRYRHYGESSSDIPSNEEILSLLEELNKEKGGNKE